MKVEYIFKKKRIKGSFQVAIFYIFENRKSKYGAAFKIYDYFGCLHYLMQPVYSLVPFIQRRKKTIYI